MPLYAVALRGCSDEAFSCFLSHDVPLDVDLAPLGRDGAKAV
jgi:hypothetical protein